MDTVSQHQVAVSSLSFSKRAELRQELSAICGRVTFNETGRILEGAELIRFIKQAKATLLIVGTEAITKEILAACPEVKLVAKYGVGLDNVDTVYLQQAGIKLGWSAGVNKRGVSELVLSYALSHYRNVWETCELMRQGIWHKDGGRLFSAKTCGIVGLGNVGQDLAQLLKAFGVTTYYHDIAPREAEALALGARKASYHDLLRECDLVTFHVPAEASTRLMFGAKELSLVKPDAMIVNTSRGSVVDFEATVTALRNGKIGAFATDVYPEEPYDGSALRALKGLYMTPHIAGNAAESVLAMGRSAIAHVAAFVGVGGG